MKSVPFLLYSVVLVLTFIPVLIIGFFAEISKYLRNSKLSNREKDVRHFAEYAIQ